MSQSTDILEKLKTLLGMQVMLEQIELENGTVLEAESFEKGKEVFIKTEDDEKVALPEGLYDLKDGKKLIVIDEGIIEEIRKDNPNDQKEDMEDQKLEQETALEEKDEKKEMTYATKEELAEVKTMVEEIKAMIEAKDQEEKEKKMSAEVEQENELKQELSKPAATAIKHSPETATRKREVLHSQNRSMTTLDKVMQRISKINN
tara:strand:- start:89 stop:700 length:612 start_codon:yes stop_codon:yes gene_type:complete